jgi:gliding motility-associated-like protein
VIICYGQESVLNASGADIYNWEDNSNGSSTIINGEISRDYYVTGYDNIGCSSTASVGIDVKDCSSIFLPSAFSPNGDGNNDEYIVYADVEAIELMIFNRWGEKVFETKDINQSWDGTYKGEILGPSVYVYLCRVENYDGDIEIKKGNITLVR